jgi:protein-disulfide isomerase
MSQLLRLGTVLLALLAFAQPVGAQMTPAERQEIGEIVREYLLANPEVLEEAIVILNQRKQEQAQLAQAAAIDGASDLILHSPNQMVLGNPEGSITLVEFFDYNCSYCRVALPDLLALIESNPDLRVVMKEFPILTTGSQEAARISVAIKDLAPESYLDFHVEMFSRPGEANEEKALAVAGDLGLDTDALIAASSGEEVAANLAEVHQIAGLLGVNGTPSYVIGSEIVAGAAGFTALQDRVASIRECGVTVC